MSAETDAFMEVMTRIPRAETLLAAERAMSRQAIPPTLKLPRVVHVLSLGAGVQSTAIALMAEQGLLRWCDLDKGTDPKRHKAWATDETPIRFDAAVFADTGDEPRAVYDHLCWLAEQVSFPILIRCVHPKRNRIFSKLTQIGKPTNFPLLRRTIRRLQKVRIGTLSYDLSNGTNGRGGRFAAIPAFTTTQEGVPGGKTRRQCTKEYKTEVIERTIRRDVLGLAPRQRIKRDIELHQHFGLSYDEPSRIFGKGTKPGVKARVESGAYGNKLAHFALYDLYMIREIIVAWLAKQSIPHKTPRSACKYCPFKSNAEWVRMRDETPEEFAEAVAVDASLRTTGAVANRDMTQSMYVHRSCLPLDQAPIDEPEAKPKQGEINFFSEEECEGLCGV